MTIALWQWSLQSGKPKNWSPPRQGLTLQPMTAADSNDKCCAGSSWRQKRCLPHDTWDSQAISNQSTNCAQRCYTCEIWQVCMYSTWYVGWWYSLRFIGTCWGSSAVAENHRQLPRIIGGCRESPEVAEDHRQLPRNIGGCRESSEVEVWSKTPLAYS